MSLWPIFSRRASTQYRDLLTGAGLPLPVAEMLADAAVPTSAC